MMKKLMKMKARAFTLVEMLVVLGIISILLLLFVPNLSKQKDAVKEAGGAAVVKVVESQKELYALKFGTEPTLDDLVKEDYITQDQADEYQNAQAKGN